MKNGGKLWTKKDVSLLKNLASKNVNTDEIAKQLGRTTPAIYNKASDLSVSLKPKDK